MARSALPAAAASPLHPPPAVPSYEAALAELEALVEGLESGQWPLDRMIEGHRRGAELLALCRHRLEAVEQQVQVLEAGQTKPWSP